MNKLLILFSNYALLSFRTLSRQRKHAAINIIGLSAGLIVFMLIYLFLIHENNYDTSWRDHQRLYRLHGTLIFNGREDRFALSSFNMAQAMKTDFPEVEAATLIFRNSFSNDQRGITAWVNDQMYEIPPVTVADADFFRVFDYPFLSGDPLTALAEPNSIVLSKKTANLLFGQEDAFGKLVNINTKTYKVTAVIDKEQVQSHLVFDDLISIRTLPKTQIEQMRSDWFWLVGYTYVRFKDDQHAAAFPEKLEMLRKNTIEPWIKEVSVDGDIQLAIEPVTEIHFNTSLQYDSPSNTNRNYSYIFTFIAIFLLLIASINYMNLATARSIKRAREIGIRKAAGAHRSQLVFQFLGESVITSFLAFLLALFFTEMVLPGFNSLIGINLTLSQLYTAGFVHYGLWLVAVVLGVGLLSGSFPALVLSGYSPVAVLRSAGGFSGDKRLFSAPNLRKVLVVFQFIISIGMIISTLIIADQLRFIRHFDNGFKTDQTMVIHFPTDTILRRNSEVIRQNLLALPEVERVSLTASLPGYQSGRLMFFLGDTANPEVRTMNIYVVDHEFFDLLGLQTLEGRVFSKDFPDDVNSAFVVNRAAARFLGYENPVGVKMNCGLGVDGKIIGMVEDFHYTSLHNPVEPLVFILTRENMRYVAVRISSPNIQQSIDKIAGVWQQFDQKHIFNYHFLDNHLQMQYDRETRMMALFGWFSLIVVLISCLGLYGLSAFTIEQRTKEIGIRKVLGSSAWQTILLLIKDFVKLVFLAGLLSVPTSYFFMDEWMNNFAYRVGIRPVWFVTGFLIAMIIAVATVMAQAYKAVRSNPVDAIKYE